MTAAPAGRVRRRRLLSTAVLAGVLPLAACRDVAVAPRDGGSSEAADDPDGPLVEVAARLESEVADLLRPLAGAGSASVRARARQALEVHQAHLDLLGVDPPEPGDPGERPSGGRQAPSPQLVAAAEEALARRHAELAVRARSGPFARALAGMAASSAQQAALWRTTGRGPA